MTEIAIPGRIARSGTSKRDTPEERQRKAAMQIVAGVVLVAAIIAVAFYSQANNPKGAYIWIIGIGFGWAISQVVNSLDAFETYVTPQSVALAVGFSVAVGLFFGIYPASRAASLSPIDALRYE